MPAAAETMGQRVLSGRTALNMTQRRLAELVGVGAPYMSKIEHDAETPGEQLVARIAETLGLNPDELLLSVGRVPSDLVEQFSVTPALAAVWLRGFRETDIDPSKLAVGWVYRWTTGVASLGRTSWDEEADGSP